jgi:outer membrane lipoprotein-sorting protein
MLRFLRTASTRRLLATIAGTLAVIAGGTAIAVAATSSGPVPKAQPLASAVHQALSAPKLTGISANISFTNNLIDSSDFTGQSADPILQGASGRLWLSDDGRLRIELQSDNGDAQVVVNHRSFWISDPIQNTVYEGTLPADHGAQHASAHGIPSIAAIQSFLTQLMGRVNLSGAQPTDVAGRPAYRVTVSPKHDGGLLGSAQLAFDATRGVPLQFAIYARGNTTPVLELKATSISYGAVPASDFTISPPAGAKVVRLGTGAAAATGADAARVHGRTVTGARAVSAAVPFRLVAPASLVGLPRQRVTLVTMGSQKAAMVGYGENLGGMVVIERRAGSHASASGGLGGLSLPTVSINGTKGQELSTPLGTVLTFTRGGVSYTVLGSVPATAAELAARAL